jgi:hypothetical protein
MVGGLASRAYRLTRHRLLRNTATDPVTGYLVRISVDRTPVDPDLGGEEQGRVLCLPTTSASWANPIEAPFGPLRNFVMSGSERPNHTVLSRKLQDYLRWRTRWIASQVSSSMRRVPLLVVLGVRPRPRSWTKGAGLLRSQAARSRSAVARSGRDR